MKISSKLMNSMFIGLFAIGMMLTSGCGDDAVKGCTDQDAENYDVNADEDDGSCVYARDKFIGSYTGGLNCTQLPIMGDETDFELAPGLAQNELFINITSGAAAGLGFSGTVSGNTITVSTDLPGLALFDVNMDGETNNDDAADLAVGGSVITNDNGQTISGTLNIAISGNQWIDDNVPGGVIPDQCAFDATKN